MQSNARPPAARPPRRYLPLTMEAPFQEHLGDVLPLILDGLSDEVRGRRADTSSACSCGVGALRQLLRSPLATCPAAARLRLQRRHACHAMLPAPAQPLLRRPHLSRPAARCFPQVEGVRDAALAAGRTLVEAYARSCLPLLLPAVEAGLGGDNWRIRQSSLELVASMLFKVSGGGGDGGGGGGGAGRPVRRPGLAAHPLACTRGPEAHARAPQSSLATAAPCRHPAPRPLPRPGGWHERQGAAGWRL